MIVLLLSNSCVATNQREIAILVMTKPIPIKKKKKWKKEERDEGAE